jgi:NosR/NirI family nitrous oxide reductase transcriptional regulator
MTRTAQRALGWLRGLAQPRAPEPSYPELPWVDLHGQSSVAGVYLAGELAGTPLIKLGLNAGVALAERIAGELGKEGEHEHEHEHEHENGRRRGGLDVLVVGAGASGLATAVRARELGLCCEVLEGQRIAQTVHDMYRGKVLFAEPGGVANASALWFEECTREELLERWPAQLAELGVKVREQERVLAITGRADGFVVKSDRGEYRARRVVLALGRAGNPRKAGVPGEASHPDKLLHALSDPAAHRGQRILIYGAGDVAVEAALALCEHNEVSLVSIDHALERPNARNRDALLERVKQCQLQLQLSSRLLDFDADSARVQSPEGERRIPNDLVFEMIGSELPTAFLEQVGVRLEGRWNPGRWLALAATFLGVYSLYALKKYPETPYCWPFNLWLEEDSFRAVTGALFRVAFSPFAWLFDPAALDTIHDTLWFQQGYLYSLLYTLVLIGFGAQALARWSRIARDPSYQKWRYASLIGFQVGFFLIANVLAVQALSVQYAWRAWGLYQPWPLFFNTFHWFSASDPRALVYGFVGAGLFGTFVAIPWAAHRHGKRFCTWICGCGGLAETLGDRVRHLSAKGPRSRQWEFQGALVLAAAALATLVSVGAHGTRADNGWAAAYAYVVDFWLVAVIPIALYPFFGGKVWCRYWCPLAAYNQVLARLYGKLQIESNDRCISCTQCSKHCQVGVDVMAFARRQEPLDNRNSSCIQCGVCIDVCPMDVLSFSQRDKPRLKVLQ